MLQKGAIIYITTIGGDDLTEETSEIKTQGYYY